MPEYVSFDPNVKIRTLALKAIVYSLRTGVDDRLAILNKHGVNPFMKEWCLQQTCLNIMKEIAEQDKGILYMIGMAVLEYAEFPPDVITLKDGMESINKAYRLNHSEINPKKFGAYTLEVYNEEKRYAIFKCWSPFPSEFDRGMLKSIVHKYRPSTSTGCQVTRDKTKETRLNGGDSCSFIIRW